MNPINSIVHNISKLNKLPRYLRGYYWKFIILFSGGSCGKGLLIEKGVKFKHGLHKGFQFKNNIYIGPNTTFDIPLGSSLLIGNNTSLTGFTYISSAKSVSIGDNVLIGEYVSIRDANHGTSVINLINQQPMEPGAIVIENDIWIGRGVAILKGCNIKSGCVIGANAVVNKTFEENSILGGIPAKKLKIRT